MNDIIEKLQQDTVNNLNACMLLKDFAGDIDKAIAHAEAEKQEGIAEALKSAKAERDA